MRLVSLLSHAAWEDHEDLVGMIAENGVSIPISASISASSASVNMHSTPVSMISCGRSSQYPTTLSISSQFHLPNRYESMVEPSGFSTWSSFVKVSMHCSLAV